MRFKCLEVGEFVLHLLPPPLERQLIESVRDELFDQSIMEEFGFVTPSLDLDLPVLLKFSERKEGVPG